MKSKTSVKYSKSFDIFQWITTFDVFLTQIYCAQDFGIQQKKRSDAVWSNMKVSTIFILFCLTQQAFLEWFSNIYITKVLSSMPRQCSSCHNRWKWVIKEKALLCSHHRDTINLVFASLLARSVIAKKEIPCTLVKKKEITWHDKMALKVSCVNLSVYQIFSNISAFCELSFCPICCDLSGNSQFRFAYTRG